MTVPMIYAEVLKLVKRRGLMIAAAVVMLGSLLLVIAIVAALHASDPQGNDPVGGEQGYTSVLFLLILFGAFASGMIGATAGSGDHTAGVFRDLVATGIGRLKLLAVRFPGALAVTAAFLVVGFVLAVVVGQVGGPSKGSISSELPGDAGYAALIIGTQVVLACALATLFSSRGWIIGGLIAFQWVVEPLLIGGTHVKLREWLLGAAIDQFARHDLQRYSDFRFGHGQALLTIAVWIGVAIALAAWRISRRDA
jgi:ABC-type transport system involved in multi-copper enzyme maturation permease subunit